MHPALLLASLQDPLTIPNKRDGRNAHASVRDLESVLWLLYRCRTSKYCVPLATTDRHDGTCAQRSFW